MGGFTGNKSGVRKGLAILILAFLGFGAGWCSKPANAAEGLSVSFGQAAIGSELCFNSVLIGQELADRKWLATFAVHGDANCRGGYVRANMGAGIVRTTHFRKWTIGIGPSIWEHGDRAVGPREGTSRPQFAAQLHLRRLFLRDRLTVDLMHNSTGGSTEYNAGRNIIAVGVYTR